MISEFFTKLWARWFLWQHGYCFRHKTFKIPSRFKSRYARCRECVTEQDNAIIEERDRRLTEQEANLEYARRVVEGE